MTVEPRVEDLLASIRKAIDNDLGVDGSTTSGQSQGTLMRGALREMRVSYDGEGPSRQQADSEIATLRERIGRSRIQSAFVAPPAKPAAPSARSPARKEISNILSGQTRVPPPTLRQSITEDDIYPALEAEDQQGFAEPYQEQIWEEPAVYAPQPQGYYPPPQAALVSPHTAQSAQASFQTLADTIMSRATGDRSIEDMTRDLLRGMLKSWLDDNLPDLVERLVREEIERVARRGR